MARSDPPDDLTAPTDRPDRDPAAAGDAAPNNPDGDGVDDGDALPVVRDANRTYIRIRPTEAGPIPAQVVAGFRQLHGLQRPDDPGLLARLTPGSQPPPTVEWLLVAPTGDAPLEYAVGVDDDRLLEPLERVLRGVFPDGFEFERTATPGAIRDRVLAPADPADLAAVEWVGEAERRRDWQARLTPFEQFHGADTPAVPLAGVAETMAETDAAVVYQALVRPYADWSRAAQNRRSDIQILEDDPRDAAINAVTGRDGYAADLDDDDQRRLAQLEARDARQSFVVNARAVAVDPTSQTDPGADGTAGAAGDTGRSWFGRLRGGTRDGPRRAAGVVRELAAALTPLGGQFHDLTAVTATGADAAAVRAVIQDRTLHDPAYERWATKLPVVANRSRGIVADREEAPGFCLLGGETLSEAGGRLVAPTPGERVALPRPPGDQLQRYRGDGFVLGNPRTHDGGVDPQPVVLPPDLQRLHTLLVGATGSGKTVAATTGLLANEDATDGATIIIAPKGDGMPEAYCKAHYAKYGTLDDVLYFDCAEVLPAFSFFDIRDELAAGIDRTTAVEDRVDHYIELLTQIMGRERFEQAVRSPDVIRYLVKALFDPVNGADAFTHRDLHTAARQMHERETPPAVSDPELERMLNGVVANRARSFDEIMQGVNNRIEKIPVDRRLARIFNHVPTDDEDPHFDLAEYLDEDVTIIFDTSELRNEAQRVLAVVVLSNLWTALQRRTQRSPDDADHPLVNLYVEEAASIATTDLLQELLSQSRGFEVALTLSLQYPGQLRQHSEGAYKSVLNNTGTLLTGKVPNDRQLAERLATDDMDATAVANRLGALGRGEWLVEVPAEFDGAGPRPFLVESTAPPRGHPASDRPLAGRTRRAFQDALEDARERTRREAGVTLRRPNTPGDAPDGADTPAREAATPPDDGAPAADADGTEPAEPLPVDTALPHTRRMPPTVTYEPDRQALRCTECGNRYDPDATGMERAVECCASLATVDRDDIPICDLNLKLSPTERDALEWSDRQLMFLQAVYNAQQLRYDPPCYDLLRDSMVRLREYVDIDPEAVQDLIDAGLLTQDTDYPHRLYTVTPDGRDVIGEGYREGLDYGHGAGDLEETSEHVLAVEVTRRYLEQAYVDDATSPVTEVVPYYDLDAGAAAAGGGGDATDQRRLDLAGLDADGTVVVAVEIERVNNDVHRAAPDDFDKLASVAPDEAIWVVFSQAAGHEVLAALNDPADGAPRVEKTYADTTPPQQFSIDTPGLTAMYPVETLRRRLFDDL